MSTPQEFFAGSAAGLALFEAVAETIATFGSAAMKGSKSQIAFRRRKAFAFVWRPDRYVTTDVPAVLSFGAPQELHSPRSSRSSTLLLTSGCTTSICETRSRWTPRFVTGSQSPSTMPGRRSEV